MSSNIQRIVRAAALGAVVGVVTAGEGRRARGVYTGALVGALASVLAGLVRPQIAAATPELEA